MSANNQENDYKNYNYYNHRRNRNNKNNNDNSKDERKSKTVSCFACFKRSENSKRKSTSFYPHQPETISTSSEKSKKIKRRLESIRKSTSTFLKAKVLKIEEDVKSPGAESFGCCSVKVGIEFMTNRRISSTTHNNHNSLTSELSSKTTFSDSSTMVTTSNRHTTHKLPPLETVQIFYEGYPRQKLITEAAAIVCKIERGEYVAGYERNRMKSRLGEEICRRCSPGTAEFLSWQACVIKFSYCNSSLTILKFQLALTRLPLTRNRHNIKLHRRNLAKLKENASFYGGEFHSKIQIGEPGQEFNVLFDTGSTPLWVSHRSCNTTHTTFDPRKSRSFRKIGIPWNITYADNDSANGYLARETVTIGEDVKIKNQVFSLAIDINGTFDKEPIDGVCGLGYGNIYTKKHYRSLLENMKYQQLIQHQLFSIWYGKGTTSLSGEILFGKINHERYTGKISYFPIIPNNSGDWKIHLEAICIGNRTIKCKMEAFIDSGNIGLDLPQSFVDRIHANIRGALRENNGFWKLFCGSISETSMIKGDIGFVFGGGRVFRIPLRDFVRDEDYGDGVNNCEDGYSWSLLSPQQGNCKSNKEKEKNGDDRNDDQKTLIPSTPSTPRTTKVSSRYSRHTSHLLPSLETFELFYAGYPKHSLIVESASIIRRIENGDSVTEWEKNLLRANLGAAILKRCSPGTAEFLSWQHRNNDSRKKMH
ncbi:11820_t:CDS:2 [Ambispora leptoticha]|uniref:11820_t:CDS:1 n=1 Tax=Ambispora leptoticha TaxID=144679 RepID=A0A9N9FT73_9GLOM|nr:11820_t:CDS:2 [Ambispora leptoticha]